MVLDRGPWDFLLSSLGWRCFCHEQRREQDQYCTTARNPKWCHKSVSVCCSAGQRGSHGAADNLPDECRQSNRSRGKLRRDAFCRNEHQDECRDALPAVGKKTSGGHQPRMGNEKGYLVR